jgi:uncharacterized membrane protein
MWIAMLARHPEEIRRRGRLQDSSRTALFSAVVIGAVASLIAVAWLLSDSNGGAHHATAILLSLTTVAITWALIHTLFALRYAQHYYAGSSHPLVFPGDQPPDYTDFAYFSFVIGMTFQVSDVQIARRDLRRLALVHGVIAFGFNSAIIAILVNVVASAL